VLELRPYGATSAIACAIPAAAAAEVTVVIPRPLLSYLIASSSRGGAGTGVAASLEVLRRARVLQSTGSGTRVSVEVRATTTVELRP
jgi:hypothetical protein